MTTPTLQLGGIAGNFGAGVSRTVFAAGVVVDDQNRLRTWNDYRFAARPVTLALTGTPADSVVIGSGVARVLQLCEPLAVSDQRLWEGGSLSASTARPTTIACAASSPPASLIPPQRTCRSPSNTTTTAAALDRQGLQELARQPGGLFARYLGLAAAQQDLASRQGVFVHLNWQNAFVRRLDLAAMQRIDLARASRLSWAEARYRFDRFDIALQWQRASGAPDSVFGALPTQRAVQVLARIFF